MFQFFRAVVILKDGTQIEVTAKSANHLLVIVTLLSSERDIKIEEMAELFEFAVGLEL